VSSNRPVLQRLTTGSAAFDRILGGGLPVRSVNVIAGEPGAGKTLFALQMIFALAREGRKALYFTTLSEPSLKLVQYMQQFAFFEESRIGQEIVFADLGSVIRRKGADATLAEITGRVEREEPAVVVIDSFKAVRDILGDASALRTFVYDLAVHTAGWGAASLLVGEYTEAETASEAEFAIADGILRFTNARHELTAIREVEVLKLRGADYVTGGHFYEIGTDGLRFFPRVRNPDSVAAQSAGTAGTVSTPERASTGVAGLDAMLGGGLPRASATIVQGGTGTGKTLLGLQFLLEGARHGEAGIQFTLEETPDQLRGIAHGLGWDLPAFEERGLLRLSYVSPVELSTDRFLDRARQEVETLGARRAVLDSLTSMALGIPSDRRFKELVYALAKHLHARGVTLDMNMEVADLLGSAQLSGHGLSFAADNVIQLKYVEIEGRLERGLSVLKARGVRHATDVRRLSVEKDGVEVGSPFEGLRGVLTGLPVPSRKR
jgi:circadian clock protein KaiC